MNITELLNLGYTLSAEDVAKMRGVKISRVYQIAPGLMAKDMAVQFQRRWYFKKEAGIPCIKKSGRPLKNKLEEYSLMELRAEIARREDEE